MRVCAIFASLRLCVEKYDSSDIWTHPLRGNNKMKYAHTESDRDRDFWQKGIVL